MTNKPTKDISASIKQRLLNHARTTGLDFNALLIRFAMERFPPRIKFECSIYTFFSKMVSV